MVIAALTGDSKIKNKFKPSINFPTNDRRWAEFESQEMAKNKYRDTYLPNLQLSQSNNPANTVKSTKSDKLGLKKVAKPKPKN